MQVLGVVGPSGAGKTTLVERVLPRLVARDDGNAGARVATVKSIHHDVEVDEPGKDTHRHREAGAAATVGVTPARTFGFVERGKSNHAGEAGALEPVLAAFADRGVGHALVEGFASSSLPRVVVGGPAGGDTAGPVVARVDDGATADVGSLLDALDGVRGYETAASVAERERRAEPGGTVAVVTVEAAGLSTATDWTGDRIPDAVESVRHDVLDRPAVERATAALRPPVEPGGTAAFHVAVDAADAEGAFAAAAAAGGRLASSAGEDATVEYLLR